MCAYGGLIREPLLSDYRILNVHPSLLPRWRGAAPVERAIMAGDVDTGVSIMELVEALDAGPVAPAAPSPSITTTLRHARPAPAADRRRSARRSTRRPAGVHAAG